MTDFCPRCGDRINGETDDKGRCAPCFVELARRREYNREYEQRPEVKARRREYEQRPEVKARHREYMRKKRARQRAERDQSQD